MSAVTLTVLFFNLLPTAFAQTFSDVSDVNRNATAIEFLAKNNIISGYPDGTFQPDKPVSRVEFLKLALLSSDVKLDVTTPSGFKDVDENAWYAPYLRKAKQEGWVQGYPDNTFKPDQSVNKVEGLKMIAEIQGWQIPTIYETPFKDTATTAWYTPFVAYAKWHNFLEESGNYFIPSASLSRAKTSEILFRSLVTQVTGKQTYSPDLIDEVPEPLPNIFETPASVTPAAAASFTPVSYKNYTKTYFNNITLNEDFPNTFYTDELYTFSGQINSGTYDTAFVFLNDDVTEDFENTSDNITNGSFSIPVIFRNPGNYKLGIVPGNTTQSKYVEISVLPSLPNAVSKTTSTIPTNLKAQYNKQKTTFSWNNGTDNLTKITFTEGSLSKTFFSRQNIKSFDAIYNDFQNFKPGQISFYVQSAKAAQIKPLTIDTAWTSSDAQTFTATQHTFSETHPDLIAYNSLPEIMNGPGTITISGTAISDIYQEAAVIKPDGLVDFLQLQTNSTTTTNLNSPVIPSGGNYSFTYPAPSNGTYIVEINGKNGLAVINTPVYVGNGIPLIPDFFDLVNSTVPDTNTSTNILINNLLKLINQERTKYGLAPVSADSSLNTLAQNHSDDMWNRGYFGHVSPDGQTPDDRRLALGITTEVGENLATAPNLLYAHNGLMRSAVHRMNILEPSWTRVGLGITKTSDNYFIVVEEFSTTPLDAAALNTMKTHLKTKINQQRQSSGVPDIITNSTLESIADNWSSLMATQKFFDFVAPDGSSLAGNIQKAITNQPVQIYILESKTESGLANEIFSSTEAASPTWTTVGIGLHVDNEGALKLTLLLST